MSTEHYQRALDAARREYEQLAAQRDELDSRLTHLRQTINQLCKLCGFVPTVPWGLTDACRVVLKSAGWRLTAVEMRERLTSIGFDLDKYANPLAAIHTVLKRLTDAGEIPPADPHESARATDDMMGSGMTAPGVRVVPVTSRRDLTPWSGGGPRARKALTRKGK